MTETNEQIAERMARRAAEVHDQGLGVLREPRFSMGGAPEHVHVVEEDGVRAQPLHLGPFPLEELSDEALKRLQQSHGPNARSLKAAFAAADWYARVDATQPTYDAKLAALQRDERGNRRWARPVTAEQIAEARDRERQMREHLPVDEAQRLADEARAALERQQTAISTTEKKIKELEDAHAAALALLDEELAAGVDAPEADPFSIERSYKTEQRRLILQQQDLPALREASKAADAELRESKEYQLRHQAGEQFSAEMAELEEVLAPLLEQLVALGDKVRGLDRHVLVSPGLSVLLEKFKARARRSLEDAGLLERKVFLGPDGRYHGG
jgi:hypothetical protein